MDKFYLLDIISGDYDLLRKSFCGKTDKEIINAGAETIEDIFHDKLLGIIQNYSDHFLPIKSDEFDFIIKTLRVKASQKRQIVTIEYNDYFENRASDEPDPDYSEKLQLLLIHYNPNITRHKKAS